MAFVQIIEFRTDNIDEMRKIGAEWEASAATGRTARRRLLCQDRDNPGRYFNIVFFDSFDSAMQNSELPATQKFAERLAASTQGGRTFYNLDVIEDKE